MAMTQDDRGWLTRELDEIKGLLRVQNGRVGLAETRLTIIETERKKEAESMLRRGTWAGIVAACGFEALMEVVKFWGRRG